MRSLLPCLLLAVDQPEGAVHGPGCLPGRAASERVIEDESLRWMVQCTTCGFEQSVWSLGGVRYKARGNKVSIRRCPSCDRRGKHEIYFAGDLEAAPSRAIDVAEVVEAAREAAPEADLEADLEFAAASPEDAVDRARTGRMSFGAVFAVLAVAKVLVDNNTDAPTPSWFLLFLICGALAGASMSRRKTSPWASPGCLLILGIAFLASLISWLLTAMAPR